MGSQNINCVKCSKYLNLTLKSENPLQCFICENFWHATCANIEASKVYKLIIENQNLLWSCDNCKDKRLEYAETLTELGKIKLIMEKQSSKLEEHDSILKKLSENKLKTAHQNYSVTPKRSFSEMCQNDDIPSYNGSAKKTKTSIAKRPTNFNKPPVLISRQKKAQRSN